MPDRSSSKDSGAPFWYNVLRQLANLRPMLATKITQETEAQKAA